MQNCQIQVVVINNINNRGNSMLKHMYVLLIVFSGIFIYGCQKDTSPVNETPTWLNNYIENIKEDPSYYGTVITRYEWKKKYYYDVDIPISSCIICDVYNQYGERMLWNDSSATDFVNNRKNGFVIWHWEGNL